MVVHGFPSAYELEEGRHLFYRLRATLEGFVGDTATTVPRGRVSSEVLKLFASLKSLERAIHNVARENTSATRLGRAGTCRGAGYSVVRDYVGHGIGRRMHEDPQIPNTGRPEGRESKTATFSPSSQWSIWEHT